MKRKVPRFRHKVHGVPGDCMLPGLGLTSADKKMLVDKVSTMHSTNMELNVECAMSEHQNCVFHDE